MILSVHNTHGEFTLLQVATAFASPRTTRVLMMEDRAYSCFVVETSP